MGKIKELEGNEFEKLERERLTVNKHSILYCALIAITINITGCGSSPKVKFYTMNALDRMPLVSTTYKPTTVKLGPVSMPEMLIQPRIVSRSGSNELLLNEFNRWGGDFQNDFQRILGENISALLPTEYVILDEDRTPLSSDFQVIVNVREFSGELGGIVTLNADWIIVYQNKEKYTLAKKSVLKENTNGSGYPAYVATQSKLLAKLSQEIVDKIKSQLK